LQAKPREIIMNSGIFHTYSKNGYYKDPDPPKQQERDHKMIEGSLTEVKYE